MGERGFNMSVILAKCVTQLAIPSSERGKKQESPWDVKFTWRIANVWIFVARTIGSIKQKYSLLDKTLPIDF